MKRIFRVPYLAYFNAILSGLLGVALASLFTGTVALTGVADNISKRFETVVKRY